MSERQSCVCERECLPVDEGMQRWQNDVPLLTWEYVRQAVFDLYGLERVADIALGEQKKMEIPEHTHTYLEILYVMSGDAIHRINGAEVKLGEGDFCILPPFISHAQSCSVQTVMKLQVRPEALKIMCSGGVFSMSSGQIGRFLLDCSSAGNVEQLDFIVFHTGQNLKIRQMICEMSGEFLASDNYTGQMLGGMLLVLFALVERTYKGSLESAGRGKDVRILAAITENSATITLKELAQQLHYSVPYCSKYIRKLFGCTFLQLLQQIRFQKAEPLLKNTTMTVEQISGLLGYENQESFMRAFKKKYHMTPSQYRDYYMNKE